MNKTKEDGYLRRLIEKLFGNLLFDCVVIILMWGLVPALAKSADFPGGFTTFWVNVFSAFGVLAFMLLLGTWRELKEWKSPIRLRYVGISVLWPLGYSIAYFSVVKMNTGSLATLLNYMWPLVALFLLGVTGKMRIPRVGVLAAIGAFSGVLITLLLEGNLVLLLPAILVGIIAPITQAYFNVETSDEGKYSHLWLLTLIGAIVTVIGSAFYIAIVEQGQFFGPTPSALLPLAVIGVGGNSLGFYAFVKASQVSNRSTDAKAAFLISMFLVPFAQLLALFTRGVETSISTARWIGVGIVAVSLLGFKYWEYRQKKPKG